MPAGRYRPFLPGCKMAAFRIRRCCQGLLLRPALPRTSVREVRRNLRLHRVFYAEISKGR